MICVDSRKAQRTNPRAISYLHIELPLNAANRAGSVIE
jgi:hypothetical protein